MSDIIYTPPASSGGGTTINPTNTYIPVRTNATTFADSVLQCVPNTFVSSVRSGIGLGFAVSFTATTSETYIGDFNNLIDSKFIRVQNDTTTSRIYSSNAGFYLDFNSKTYSFGDYNGTNNNNKLIISDSSNYIASFTNNAERMRIISNGNVGIATTTPQGLWSGDNKTLNILSPANNSSELVLQRTAGLVDTASFSNFLSGTSDEFGIYTSASLNYVIYTTNSERMRITTAGNVGIGTTAPSEKFAVNGNIALPKTGNTFIYNDQSGTDSVTIGGAQYFSIKTFNGANYVEALRVTASQNVGIGTTSPSRNLEVVDTTEVSIRVRETGGNFIELYQQATDSYIFSSSNLFTYTNSLPRMVVASNGLIGIGTTSPVASAQLQVVSPNFDTGFLCPQIDDASIRAIPSPAEGLMVYNTDIAHVCFYQGGAWVKISHSPM